MQWVVACEATGAETFDEEADMGEVLDSEGGQAAGGKGSGWVVAGKGILEIPVEVVFAGWITRRAPLRSSCSYHSSPSCTATEGGSGSGTTMSLSLATCSC